MAGKRSNTGVPNRFTIFLQRVHLHSADRTVHYDTLLVPLPDRNVSVVWLSQELYADMQSL
jgi:hypothetical protein